MPRTMSSEHVIGLFEAGLDCALVETLPRAALAQGRWQGVMNIVPDQILAGTHVEMPGREASAVWQCGSLAEERVESVGYTCPFRYVVGQRERVICAPAPQES